ncbi:MAG: GNAT family N-acetyltransferase [Myxococcales bacterium]|nr:MAG: GNAT family N-acetyltransferase [Myxococcales bacterium]
MQGANMSDLIVRDGCIKDAEVITTFQQRMAWVTEGKSLDAETVSTGVRTVFNNPEFGCYLVAEIDGEVVGSLLITQEWSDWRNGLFWWIQSVYVDENVRRRGVYRAMHEEARKRAKAAGNVVGIRLYVERENTIAQQSYMQLGMKPTHYDVYEELVG